VRGGLVAVETAAKNAAAKASLQLYPYVASLARRGRYREAESWVSMLLRIAPRPDLYCLLGKIYAQQRRYDDASRAFRKAVALEPSDPSAVSALARSERLRERPGLPMGPWRLGVAALVLLMAVAAIPFLIADDRGVDTASSGANRQPSTNGRGTESEDTSPMDLRLLDEYASLLSSLKSLPSNPPLVFTPGRSGSGLSVRVTGSVPTEHLATLVSRKANAPNIDVDATTLQITQRYVVRSGDTLTSIAGALYGDSKRWRMLWAANKHHVRHADLINVGTVLRTP
jgi:nucleoid-associated protein YgaU